MAIDFKSVSNNSFQSLASGVSAGVGSSIGGAIGGLMTKFLNPSAYKAAMREHLTGAEREQNAFNAQQAAIARQFDLDMFNREVELENSSFQRQVSDMQKAGVNPALMYGGTGASGADTPTASSAAQASAVTSPADVNALVQLQMAGAQLRNINAQTDKIKSEIRGQDIDNANKPEYWERQLALIGANKDVALANIENLYQQAKTGAADEALKRANEKLTGSKISQTDLENAILAYKVGMTATESKFYEAMKSLDLALKSATLDKTEEEVKIFVRFVLLFKHKLLLRVVNLSFLRNNLRLLMSLPVILTRKLLGLMLMNLKSSLISDRILS